jgi:hypothetical protein
MLVDVLRMCMGSETGTYKELDCNVKDFKEKNMGFWKKEGGVRAFTVAFL